MPTKRLSKPRQHTDSKENVIGTLVGKVAASRMDRKRSRSVPSDVNVALEPHAVLRESQDDNNDDDDRDAEVVEDTSHRNGSEERIRRHMNAAKLYAQSVQNANARVSGHCKRIKTDSQSMEGCQLVSQDGKVVTANSNVSDASTELAVSNNTQIT